MISILFATNGRVSDAYLDKALQQLSLLQRRGEFTELVFVHNSSDMVFHEKLKTKLSEKGLLGKLIHQPEADSMGKNWTQGLQYISQKWVLVHHDDDYLLDDAFMNISQYLVDAVGFVSFCHDLENDHGIRRKVSRQGGLMGLLQNTPKFISTIYNTEQVKKNGGWDDRFGYFLDFVLLAKLEMNVGSKNISKSIGVYRVHQENASALRKRASGYLAYLPAVLTELFPLITDENQRKELLYHTVTFSCPHESLIQKIASKFAKALGCRSWVLK